MRRVFNLGLGMVVIVKPEQADLALAELGEGWRIGQVIAGERMVWAGE